MSIVTTVVRRYVPGDSRLPMLTSREPEAGQDVTDSRSALPVGDADVLPEAVLEVDAGLLDDGLRAGGAGEEPGQGEGAGELAVRGDQVRVRGQGCPVDLGLG